jgi:hypothetical protein
MPRALSMRPFPQPDEPRESRLRAMRERRALAKACGCNYWVFAEEGDPNALVEFVEGPDRAALIAASGPLLGDTAPPKILLEVELG